MLIVLLRSDGEYVEHAVSLFHWANQLGLGSGDIIVQILSLLSYLFIFVFIFYGQRIQMYVMIREVESSLYKLKFMKEEGRKTAMETIKEIGKPSRTLLPKLTDSWNTSLSRPKILILLAWSGS